MSHYSVAVFHREDQDVDELLAPYSELLEVPKHVVYTRQEAIDLARDLFKECKDKTDDECWEFIAEDYADDMKDEDGNLYSNSNPNAKWDWYELGGRWSDSLRLKDGSTADEAKIRDIDFTPNKNAYRAGQRFWDAVVEGRKFPGSDRYFALYKKEYYIERYGTREEYAKSSSEFKTFAVVTPDGEWHEQGEMGWFGLSSDTPAEARKWHDDYQAMFIDSADPDLILSVYDCHI